MIGLWPALDEDEDDSEGCCDLGEVNPDLV